MVRPSRLVLGKKFFQIWFIYTPEGCVLVLHYFFSTKCHLWNTLVIMYMAMAKQATTIVTQVALAALDLEVEICTRPWIVELSRNSRILAVAIFKSNPSKALGEKYASFSLCHRRQTEESQPVQGRWRCQNRWKFYPRGVWTFLWPVGVTNKLAFA